MARVSTVLAIMRIANSRADTGLGQVYLLQRVVIPPVIMLWGILW